MASAPYQVDTNAVRIEQQQNTRAVQQVVGSIIATLPHGIKRDIAPGAAGAEVQVAHPLALSSCCKLVVYTPDLA